MAREPDGRRHYPSEVPSDESLCRQTGCLHVGKLANMIEQLQLDCSGFFRLQFLSLDVNQDHAGFRKSKIDVGQLLKRNQHQSAHEEDYEAEANLPRNQGSTYSASYRVFATAAVR